MTKEIDRNLVDLEVKRWIMPKFSTTTNDDEVTMGVVFMGAMKKYFKYVCDMICGIPEVTLEGTIEDWKEIQRRLAKLKEYKLKKWHGMLVPILKEFVAAKEGNANRDFWQKICHYQSEGSGVNYVSGWITAFCLFDKDGNEQGKETKKEGLKIDIKDITTGIVEVDVKITGVGTPRNAVLVAGHMGAEIKDDGCTVQPVLGWSIALKKSK